MVTEAIRSLAENLPGKIGIAVMDLVTGEQFAYNADLPVIAASVIKVPIMAEAFRQKEAGLLSFAEEITVHAEDCLPSCGVLTYMHRDITVQIGDLVTLMIILSDNTATNLLIDRLGMENINAMIESIGLTQTCCNRKLFQPELSAQGIQNYITAGDMCRMLQLLHEGKVVSAEASAEMLRILGNQRLNGKMPFFLHSMDIRCAHKTGEDDGITHDVGIIYAEHPVIFCFVSEETDVPAAERAIQDIAAIVAGVKKETIV